MTYKEWFANHDELFVKGAQCVLTVTSDKLGRDAELLSVTLTPTVEAPYYNQKTLFVAGGDPFVNAHITGINPEHHRDQALGRMACVDELRRLCPTTPLLITHAANYYTGKMLQKTFPELFLNRALLDVISMIKVRELGKETEVLAKADSLESMIYWTEIVSMELRGAYGIDDCFNRSGLASVLDNDTPTYLKRGQQVALLFSQLIIM